MGILGPVAALALAIQSVPHEHPFAAGSAFSFTLPEAHSPWNAPAEPAGADVGVVLRSLALPGWGQRAQGRAHWWIFPLVESAGWGGWLHGRREGDRFRNRYRDIAWDRARRSLWDGPRSDGPWEYYERMIRWHSSGAFDREPDLPGLAPEEDPATFNGAIWELARALYLGGRIDVPPDDPGYLSALEYYRSRAVPPELAWDWDGDDDARVRFGALVRDSDEAYRRATGFIGLVLVNRFVAAVEAWVAEHPGPLERAPVRATGRVAPGGHPGEWSVRIDVRARGAR